MILTHANRENNVPQDTVVPAGTLGFAGEVNITPRNGQAVLNSQQTELILGPAGTRVTIDINELFADL